MPIIDLHQDLFSHLIQAEGKLQTSFALIEGSPIELVVASTFNMHPRAMRDGEDNTVYSQQLIDLYHLQAKELGWRVVKTASDLQVAEKKILIHVEGLQGETTDSIPEFEQWLARGCRSIGLMSNFPNRFGGTPQQPHTGLSRQGIQAVKWLDTHPVILDVSFMSRQTFWDTVRNTSNTLVASHSNVKAITADNRNLDDKQIKAIAERNGVIGLTFSKRFLGLSQGIQAIVRHAEYIAELVGVEHVAIGTGLGGLLNNDSVISSVKDLSCLQEAFSSSFTEQEFHKIAYDNAYRVIHSSLLKTIKKG